MRRFDLNIETFLEHWTLADALRELIANALDEQVLTKTPEIQIFGDNQGWHIRDYGRGLGYEHLTQNENEEKLRHPQLVIGKFGVGLKDALATLNRHQANVLIGSKHGDIRIERSPKHGFEDVNTLHALILDPADPAFAGTEFILRGVEKEHVEQAKSFFLRFSGEETVEATRYGQVLKRRSAAGRVYINGVRAAEEETFLFSYNITSVTPRMRRALNREKGNVGRTVYADRTRAILLACNGKVVGEMLCGDLRQLETGAAHDELKWNDVAEHACKLLNARSKAIFVTASERGEGKDLIEDAETDGHVVVVVPESIRRKLRGAKDVDGQPIRDLEEYRAEWNRGFRFSFVDPGELAIGERDVYANTGKILELAGGRPAAVREVLISETMRMEGFSEALGLWEKEEGRIIIKRSQLRSLRDYAGTLLHEIGHARSGEADCTRGFENALTGLLGMSAENALARVRGEGGKAGGRRARPRPGVRGVARRGRMRARGRTKRNK